MSLYTTPTPTDPFEGPRKTNLTPFNDVRVRVRYGGVSDTVDIRSGTVLDPPISLTDQGEKGVRSLGVETRDPVGPLSVQSLVDP